MSTILITGATGLVGSYIAKMYLQKNYTVHYLTTSKNKLKNTDNFKGFYWDVKNNVIDKEAFTNVESIIHLSGATIAKRWTSSYKKEIIQSRIQSSELLFNTLKEINHSVKNIVCASAIGIYKSSLSNKYDENSKEFADTFLAEVVKKWENATHKFNDLNISTAQVRIGLVLSDKGGALVPLLKSSKFRIGTVFGSGNQYQSWIHIHDLAQIFITIQQNKLSGIFNAVSPNVVTQKEMVKAISNATNYKTLNFFVPKFFMKLVLGEMHILLFESQYVVPKKIIYIESFSFKYNSIEYALKSFILQ